MWRCLKGHTLVTMKIPYAKSGSSGATLRVVTAFRIFVDEAPLDLVYVADHRAMAMVPVASRRILASAAAGAIAQTLFILRKYGLSTVIRAWIDRTALPTRWDCLMITSFIVTDGGYTKNDSEV